MDDVFGRSHSRGPRPDVSVKKGTIVASCETLPQALAAVVALMQATQYTRMQDWAVAVIVGPMTGIKWIGVSPDAVTHLDQDQDLKGIQEKRAGRGTTHSFTGLEVMQSSGSIQLRLGSVHTRIESLLRELQVYPASRRGVSDGFTGRDCAMCAL